jgi:predicted O-methyltransferase YrrM
VAFIDADKTNYRNYYEAILPKLADRGLMVVDNTLWGGQVLDASDTSDDNVAIREFNDFVAQDPRVVAVQLTVRDGVTLIRRA